MHIYALTDKGHSLAKTIKQVWPEPVTIFFKPDAFKASVQNSFRSQHPLILICATGIAVRVLADVLIDKYQDPPVLVLDEHGRFVIPLLSGHQGGANQLANQLAHYLLATPIITTANHYLDPVYTLGVGCERHCPDDELAAIIDQALKQVGRQLADMQCISSIAIKADERCMLNFSKNHDLDFLTYDVDDLKTVESQLSQRSDYVFKTVGVYGVAESAALLSAQSITGNIAELAVKKIKNTKATCAIARSYPVTHKIEAYE